MSESKKIRLATVEDSVALLNIYGEYIKNTSISFETEVPSVEVFGKRIENTLERFPWLVCEIDGKVAGYAYASKHRERAAYQWSADLSIYVDKKYHRKHIATALYTALIELLKSQGYYSAFAGTTVPNPNSEEFHTAFGFQLIGVFEKVGYKLGEWRDVKWFKLSLLDYAETPELPLKIQDIDLKIFEGIVEKAAKL